MDRLLVTQSSNVLSEFAKEGIYPGQSGKKKGIGQQSGDSGKPIANGPFGVFPAIGAGTPLSAPPQWESTLQRVAIVSRLWR